VEAVRVTDGCRQSSSDLRLYVIVCFLIIPIQLASSNDRLCAKVFALLQTAVKNC